VIGTIPAIALVARREIVERIRERSLWVSTAITVAVLAGVLVLPAALGFGGATKGTVAVSGPQAAAAAARRSPASMPSTSSSRPAARPTTRPPGASSATATSTSRCSRAAARCSPPRTPTTRW